jgi:transcriptional antiterminator RfaH
MAIAWYVVRSATRQEARAERGLREQGFAVYLPCRTRFVSHARKREAKKVPLFPGYLFVGIDHESQSCGEVNDTDGVHKLVSVSGYHGEPAEIPQLWVTAVLVHEVFGTFDATVSSRRRFEGKKGDKVEITGGCFIGRLATLMTDVGAADKKTRVELHGLGGGKMPVDTDQLRAA